MSCPTRAIRSRCRRTSWLGFFLEVGGGGEKLSEPYPYFYFMSSIPCNITIVKSVLSSVMFEKKCQMSVASDYFCAIPPSHLPTLHQNAR